MKPATMLTVVVLILIAFLHVLRLVLGVEIRVDGTAVPAWPSALAVLLFAGLAAGLWYEHGRAGP